MNTNTTPNSSTPPPSDDFTPTPIQIVLGIMIVGTSAGLTLYTKKTGQMLRQMDKLNQATAARKAAIRRKQPAGPMTKKEYDTIRPRLEKDELF